MTLVRIFRWFAIAWCLSVSTAWAQPASVPAARQANNVAVITIRTGDGPIDGVTAKSFVRRLKLAEQAGADAIVVEIDTPGGEIGAVLDICAAIKGSSIQNSVAWINTKAISGGAIIALACREIVVTDSATMGDALPIAASPLGLAEMPEQERAKFLVMLLTEVVDSARRKNQGGYVYDELLVQAILTTGVELWRIRHRTTGQEICITRAEYKMLFGAEPSHAVPRVASLRPGAGPPQLPIYPVTGGGGDTSGLSADQQQALAIPPAGPALSNVAAEATGGQSLPRTRPVLTPDDRGQWDLVEYVTDGTVPAAFTAADMRALGFAANMQGVNTDEDLKAWFGATHLKRLDPLWSEGLVQFMTRMWVRGLLIVLLLMAIFSEMVAPNGIGGIIAAVAIALLLIPPFLMGMANWWEILAIVGGLALIGLEAFVFPGFGFAGISGIILLFLGLLGTFVPNQGGGLFPNSPDHQKDLLYGLLTIVLAVATSGVGWWFMVRHFGTIPLLNRMILKDAGPGEGESMLAAMASPRGPTVRVGQTGRSATTLRPSGQAEFDGQVIDVVAENGYIDRDQPVKVVEVGRFRIVVAPFDTPGSGDATGGFVA
ncbi:MAG: hypothetical protein KF866_10040 [Phycisphaeraceae bacterium]|nr:hypothetical protein [Phycisphaeraceae bacterium]MCW5754840.1 hypothetical protein [Phycisphaeraceae bacterium]